MLRKSVCSAYPSASLIGMTDMESPDLNMTRVLYDVVWNHHR